MKPAIHKIYISLMVFFLIATVIYLVYNGYSYYITRLGERFYHADHIKLKPNGLLGHGLGIVGSLSMLTGVTLYMLRKRKRSMARLGKIKHWLAFHIFLCTLGPLLVIFHTSFKIGGLVLISFWSMIAVALSGVLGRFIYIQIPRTIEGREMSLNEVRDLRTNLRVVLGSKSALDGSSLDLIEEAARGTDETKPGVRSLKQSLRRSGLSYSQRSDILKLVKNEISLNHRIERLQTMQNLFRYWHVAHLPLAIIMLIIMIIHVGISVVFGYTWVF